MNRNEVFNEGPTTSQHVEANSDDQFKNSTYKLKRTRSMGGFDDFLLQSSTNSTVSSSSSGNNTITNSNSNSSSNINNNNSNSNDTKNQTTASANPNDKKLTSRDFISDKTLKKLNIPASTTVNYYDDLESVPSFYRSVMGTSKSKALKNNNNNNNKYTSNGVLSPDSISSVNDSVLTDYSSEDSMSSINSNNSNIVNNLIPKHQLKKQQQLQQSASADMNNSNNDDSNSDNHHMNEQQQPLISYAQLHDDIDVQYSPEQHVDYLSHDWDESEISKSWRYVIMKRNDFANAARLENASWRTWAQTRNGLKTISPAELNWSKDSDVTWLYGPLYKNDQNEDMSDSTTDSLKPLNSIPTNGTDNDSTNNKNNTNKNDNKNDNSNPSVSSIDSGASSNSSNKNDHANNNNKNNDTLSISSTLTNATLTSPTIHFIKSASDSPVLRPSSGSLYQKEEHLKPILKKKTNVEKIMSEASYSRLQILLDEREHKFNGSPILEHTSGVAVSPFLHSDDVNTSTPSISLSNDKIEDQQQQQAVNKKDRHIHFNMRVDQCIALDSEFHDYDDRERGINDGQLNTSDGDEDEDDDDDDDDDECSTDYEYQSESDDAQNDTSKSIVSSSYHDDGEFTLPDHVVNVTPQDQHHHHTSEIRSANDEDDYEDFDEDDEDDDDDADDDDDDDDDDDGFMINPQGNKNISHVPRTRSSTVNKDNTEEEEQGNDESNKPVSPNNSKKHKKTPSDKIDKKHRRKKSGKSSGGKRSNKKVCTIAPLPSTCLKNFSDDEEEHLNDYTVSHNTRTNRGYDYYYNYNEVYTNVPSNNSDYGVIGYGDYNSSYILPSSNQDQQKDDVQMFDIPANCQIEDVMDLDSDLHCNLLNNDTGNNNNNNNNNHNNNNTDGSIIHSQPISVASSYASTPSNSMNNSPLLNNHLSSVSSNNTTGYNNSGNNFVSSIPGHLSNDMPNQVPNNMIHDSNATNNNNNNTQSNSTGSNNGYKFQPPPSSLFSFNSPIPSASTASSTASSLANSPGAYPAAQFDYETMSNVGDSSTGGNGGVGGVGDGLSGAVDISPEIGAQLSFDSPLFSKNTNELSQNMSSDGGNGGLKRTSSLGASKTFLSMMNNDNYTNNSNDNNNNNNNNNNNSNDFANSMKVGQSGLDLKSTGLRASSTNIRSKNQLSQLFRDSQIQLNNNFNSNDNDDDNNGNEDSNNKATFSSGRGNDIVVGRPNSTNNNKTFLFNADSDSEDEEDGLNINQSSSNSNNRPIMPSSFSSNSVINGNNRNKSFTFGSNDNDDDDDDEDDEDEDDGMMINTRPKLSSVQQNSSSSVPHFHSSRTPSFTNTISQATSTSGTSGDFVTTSTESDRPILVSSLSNSNIRDSTNNNNNSNNNNNVNDSNNATSDISESGNTSVDVDQSGNTKLEKSYASLSSLANNNGKSKDNYEVKDTNELHQNLSNSKLNSAVSSAKGFFLKSWKS